MLVVLVGCAPDPDYGRGTLDVDGDGIVAAADCDDGEAALGFELTFWIDADGDGFGATTVTACRPDGLSGVVDEGGDCDDANRDVFPGALEICDDVDQDCDGGVDEGASDAVRYFVDADGDGVGREDGSLIACEATVGFADTSGDCDDEDPARTPGEAEVCDDGVDANCVIDCVYPGLISIDSLQGRGFLFTSTTPGTAIGSKVASAGDIDRDGYDDLLVTGDTPAVATEGPIVFLLRGPITSNLLLPVQASLGVRAGALDVGFPTAMAGVGDVDEDGYDDVALTRSGALLGAGAAWILRGPFDDVRDVSDADWVLSGQVGDALGGAIARVGDLDGDGRRELVVGAPGRGSAAGALFVYSGRVPGADDAGWERVVINGASGDQLGGGPILDAGDLNGDGLDDLFATAPGTDRVYVIFGSLNPATSVSSATPRITHPTGSSDLGASLASMPDVDGDGLGELVIGAPGLNGRGAVIVIHSARDWTGTTNASTSAALTVQGGAVGDRFGTAVAGADHDRDGFADVFATGPGGFEGAGGLVGLFGPWAPGTEISLGPSAPAGRYLVLAGTADAALAPLAAIGGAGPGLLVGAPDAGNGTGGAVFLGAYGE